MRRFIICFAALCLLAPLSALNFAAAQAEADITIAGSGMGNALLRTLAESVNIESIDITTNGTAAGIDQFCNGSIDIAVASRAISSAEDAICIANDVAYSEFLFAHKIVALAASKEVTVSCLRQHELEDLLRPSSSNRDAHWSDFGGEDDLPAIALTLPSEESIEYAILDSVVAGDRLRRDVETYLDSGEALTRLAESDVGLAALPYSEQLAGSDSHQILEGAKDYSADCVSPSAENVESNLYPYFLSVYLYVNRTRLADNATLDAYTRALISTDAAGEILGAGFTPPSDETITRNAQTHANPEAALTIGGGETEFVIPGDLNGEVVVSGAANVHELLDRVTTRLPNAGERFQIKLLAPGQSAGMASLCAGEADIATITTDSESLDAAECGVKGIVPVPITIGSHAAVLLGNASDDHTACLTLNQIHKIWSAQSADSVTHWHHINEAMPEVATTLFGLSSVDRYADILMSGHPAPAPPIRRDTEIDYDPLYRAAAVANVSGALTYMSFIDYQKVLDNQQANVRPVAVDAGNGCVPPTSTTVSDGSYPLSRPAHLLVSELSLAHINVQSVLWSLFADENWYAIELDELVGIDRADLPSRRRQLETLFRMAEANAPPPEEEAEASDEAETPEDESE